MENWDSQLAVDEKEWSNQRGWLDGKAGRKHTSHPRGSITGTKYGDSSGPFQEQ